MNNYAKLFTVEWLKIKNYKAFWITLSILFLVYPLVNFIVYYMFNLQLEHNKELKIIRSLIADPFTFPTVWQSVAYFSSFFIIVPSFLIVMLACNEFTFKTHRQNIIEGFSRTEFVTAKILDVIIIAAFTSIVCFLVAAFFGSINDPSSMVSFCKGAYFILLFFIQQVAQLSIALFIALLLRKAFITIIILFFLLLADNIGSSILLFKHNGLASFLPYEMSDQLVPISSSFFKVKFSQTTAEEVTNHILWQLLYTVIFIGLLWFGTIKIFNKRDL